MDIPTLDHVPARLDADLQFRSAASVRRRAIFDLGRRVKPSAALDPLLRALDDEDSGVRFAAAFELGRIGLDEAIRPLAKKLEDSDKEVRVMAARSLERLGAIERVGGDRPGHPWVFYGLGVVLLVAGVWLAQARSDATPGVIVAMAGIVLLLVGRIQIMRGSREGQLLVLDPLATGDPTVIAAVYSSDLGGWGGDFGGFDGGGGDGGGGG